MYIEGAVRYLAASITPSSQLRRVTPRFLIDPLSNKLARPTFLTHFRMNKRGVQWVGEPLIGPAHYEVQWG